MTAIARKKLLILDLDETLIYSTEEPLEREADFKVEQYFVYTRPFLGDFLAFGFKRFDVGVWTTSTADYARMIVNQVTAPNQTLQFLWSRERCTWAFDEATHERILVKKLDKLRKRGYRPESIIVIDDTVNAWRNSYGNLVRVARFEGDQSDEELRYLSKYLESLIGLENIRTVEKRNWRERIF